MDIETYLKEKSLKPSQLAKAAGLNPCVLTHIKNGRKISPYIAEKIEKGTNGELKAVDLVFGDTHRSAPRESRHEGQT